MDAGAISGCGGGPLDLPSAVPAQVWQLKLRPIDQGTRKLFVPLCQLLDDKDELVKHMAATVTELYEASAADGGYCISLQPAWESSMWRWRMPLEYADGARHDDNCHQRGRAIAFRGERDRKSGKICGASYLFVEQLTGQLCWVPFVMSDLQRARAKELPALHSTQKCLCQASFFNRLSAHIKQTKDADTGDQLLLQFARLDKARFAVLGAEKAVVVGRALPAGQASGAEIVSSALLRQQELDQAEEQWQRLYDIDPTAEAAQQALVNRRNYMPPPAVSVVPRVVASVDTRPEPASTAMLYVDSEELSREAPKKRKREEAPPSRKKAAKKRSDEKQQEKAATEVDEEVVAEIDTEFHYIPLDANGKELKIKKKLDRRCCKHCQMVGCNERTCYSPNHGDKNRQFTQPELYKWYKSLVKNPPADRPNIADELLLRRPLN